MMASITSMALNALGSIIQFMLDTPLFATAIGFIIVAFVTVIISNLFNIRVKGGK